MHRGSRRRASATSVLLALAVSLLVPLTAAPAGAGPGRSDRVAATPARHDFTTTERVVEVRTGPDRDVEIGLDTRLYVPDNASARRPQPAILMTNGFGLSQDAAEVRTTARFFASHGYVVLTYTASGFGESGGCITLQSLDYDVPSARQLITQVLEPRRDVLHDADGAVVGTIGGSYGGGIQLPLAAAEDRVKAAIPGRTWNDLAYSLDPNNRVVPGDRTGFTFGLNDQGVFKQQWTSLFAASGNAEPAQGNGGCPETKAAEGDPEELAGMAACPGYYLAVCRLQDLLSTTGDTDEEGRRLVARASAATVLHRVDTPTLLVQGQSDTLFNLNDATATYRGLERRGVPVAMIWNAGGHGGYSSQPGECEVYDGEHRTVREMSRCYLPLRSLGWMDHWLRGRDGGRGPGFTYYRDWVDYAGSGPADEQYGAARGLPRRATRFTLSGTGRLVRPGGTPRAGSVTFLNPQGGQPAAYSETSNFSGPDSEPTSSDVPPQEVAGQFASFVSARLRRPMTSVGIPSARLRISNSNGRDMVFFAKVYDVGPAGETLIHRLVAPVRVPADAVGEPVRIKLAGFVHRFARGHRVRLVLASTDQTSYNAKVADVLTVQTGPGSTFRLPGRTARR